MTYERLDKTIFRAIEREMVALGYMPDLSGAATAAEAKALLSAFAAAQPAGWKAINLLGTGAGKRRGEELLGCIVVSRYDERPGSLGAGGIHYEEYADPGAPQGVAFRETLTPQMADDVQYEVRCITDDQRVEWRMADLLARALGSRKTLRGVDEAGADTGELVLVVRNEFAVLDSFDVMERVRRYTCRNVWMEPSQTLATGILPVMEIIFEVGTTDDPDGYVESFGDVGG